jgi:hypothetical protein
VVCLLLAESLRIQRAFVKNSKNTIALVISANG